jgi:heme oxygenase|tara:strand:+ start:972 stop:1631 length:660 start_codon:yes stop_codon:yes gene_type:complete
MAYDIKELTKEIHQNAERQEFVKILMSGTIRPELYAIYLYNQLQCYSVLEKYGMHNDLFRQTPGLQRAENIHRDFKKLWELDFNPEITPSTKKYVEHIETIKDDPEKLYGHIYVRHLGDLSGGQMISKKVPVKSFYDFNGQGQEYKRIVKEIINEYLNTYKINVLSEVEYCFESATNLFKEMNEISKPLVLTNEVFEFTSDNRDIENDPFKGTTIQGKD